MRASHSPPPRSVSLSVETLEDRLVLSSSEFVGALFTGLLHRPASPADLANGAIALQSGVSPLALAQTIATSPEFRTDLIVQDFQVLLGRTPSPLEVAGWLNAFQNGLTDNQLAAAFLGSNEFFQRSGATTATWLNAVFRAELGRNVDPVGLAFFSQALATGLPRSTVALGVVTSPEANARVVSAAFASVLGRAPDPFGFVFFTSALGQGTTPGQLLAVLASSQEFIAVHAHGFLDTLPFVNNVGLVSTLGTAPAVSVSGPGVVTVPFVTPFFPAVPNNIFIPNAFTPASFVDMTQFGLGVVPIFNPFATQFNSFIFGQGLVSVR